MPTIQVFSDVEPTEPTRDGLLAELSLVGSTTRADPPRLRPSVRFIDTL